MCRQFGATIFEHIISQMHDLKKKGLCVKIVFWFWFLKFISDINTKQIAIFKRIAAETVMRENVKIIEIKEHWLWLMVLIYFLTAIV